MPSAISKTIRISLLAAGLVFVTGLLLAQSNVQASPSASSAQTANVDKVSQGGQGKTSVDTVEEEEENGQFKYTPIVRKVAKATGLSKEAAYWTFLVINFAILAAGLGWVVKKALPNGFAPRTTEIQKGIEEARKASAEASARLGEIEGRLAKLDSEIAELRTVAEANFSVEEERIKAAAEQDAKNVIAAAEQEIAAAARTAQRELKSFAAGLAVDLAEKKIKVDEGTDQALVRGFAAQLGKDDQ
jgi:F-type H+-transporting ATPase subunit b